MDDHKLYIVEREEKLSSIANKHNTTVEAIKSLNPYMKTFGGFIGGESASAMQKIKIPVPIIQSSSSIEEDLSDLMFEQEARYRCEQMVICKINGIPTNNAETKREFLVRKKLIEGQMCIKVDIKDSIINVSPETYQDAVNLVSELDFVKCNGVILLVDVKKGAIAKIINHKEIINNWNKHKNKLKSSYSFIQNKKAAKAIQDFIDLADKQITIEANLIDDLKTKMFFDVYFNKYLVNSPDKLDAFQRTYQSQLFDGFKVDLTLKQDMINEAENFFIVRKVSSIPKGISTSPALEKIYDEKYKPIIQYKFSEFNASFRERSLYNREGEYLQESEISIIEEVKNNIQLLIHYKLKKIEATDLQTNN